MEPRIALTAVYLKATDGYIGFVEEIPGVHSRGRTIEEARSNLVLLTEVVFDEERARSAELLAGKDVVRESFLVSFPASISPGRPSAAPR
jgi:predicted RNase H-like HicB family nuclease